MNKIKKLIINLNATDLLVVLFTTFLSLLAVIFSDRVIYWQEIVIINIILQSFVFTVAYFDEHRRNMFTHQLRFWYLVPTILLVFKELYALVDPIRGKIYDNLLIEIDRFLFGGDPTHFMWQFANPFIT